MNIIWGGVGDSAKNKAIAGFVAAHIDGCERGFADFTTLGVMEEGRLLAGVVYHNYSPEAGVIELSAAATSKRWLTRPVLKAMFGYPFDEIGCQMAVLRVSEENRGMAEIARRFGFTGHRIPASAGARRRKSSSL